MSMFKAARRATSLLHWRVDPEIFPLVGALSVGGMIAGYTLYSSRATFLQSLNPQDSYLDFKERSSSEHKVKLDPEKVDKIGLSLGLKKD